MIKLTSGSLTRLVEALSPGQLRAIFSSAELVAASEDLRKQALELCGDDKCVEPTILKLYEAARADLAAELYCSACKGFHRTGRLNCSKLGQ